MLLIHSTLSSVCSTNICILLFVKQGMFNADTGDDAISSTWSQILLELL